MYAHFSWKLVLVETFGDRELEKSTETGKVYPKPFFTNETGEEEEEEKEEEEEEKLCISFKATMNSPGFLQMENTLWSSKLFH